MEIGRQFCDQSSCQLSHLRVALSCFVTSGHLAEDNIEPLRKWGHVCWLKETPKRPGRSEEAAQGRNTTAVAFLGFLFTVYWYNLCGTLQTLPILSTAASQNSFQSHHKEPPWTGKNLVLIIGVGQIVRLSSKANKRNLGWRCSSRSSNHSVCTETT